jgi:lipoate-protein ligase A
MTRWRWRQDPSPGTPDENMAIDLGLLHEMLTDPEALPIVRVYSWDRPCVSIGRFQSEDKVRAVYPGLPLVRRPTGGRAVRHGDDLTLSIAARLRDLPPGTGTGVLATYGVMAGALQDAFCALGISAQFGAARDRQTAAVDCFAQAARCDIVDSVTGRKLAGCAQRRAGTALIQQMSIPDAGIPDLALYLSAFRDSITRRFGISFWADARSA